MLANKKLFILLFTAVFFLRCNEPRTPQYLSHYLTSEDIQKVEISNVHGKFILNKKQLETFRTDFLKTKTVPDLTIKTGSLSIIITFKSGETYVARGNSNSDFLEISSHIATRNKEELEQDKWLVLDTKETNFNNYKPL